MRRDDAKCRSCGWEGEVVSDNLESREKKRCTVLRQDPDFPLVEQHPAEMVACGGELEFMVAAASSTRFGFGFSPSYGDGQGNKFGPGKRRPATAKKVDKA